MEGSEGLDQGMIIICSLWALYVSINCLFWAAINIDKYSANTVIYALMNNELFLYR